MLKFNLLITIGSIFAKNQHHNMDSQKQSLLSTEQNTPPDRNGSKFDGLTPKKFWSYGVGHFINDLAATCWFNYLPYFLNEIVKTPAASWAILSGQIADGLATPVVGVLSDKTKTKYGQRKPWYIFGLVMVVCTFLPTFQNFRTLTGNQFSSVAEIAYYIIFPSLFNVGWASVQISHMSLVPSLTCSRRRRDRLNNLRNTFTFVSNFSVLAIALVLFTTMENSTLQINLLSYIVVALGLTTSLFFLFNIDQVLLTAICKQKTDNLRQELEKRQRAQIGSQENINTISEFSEDSDFNIITSKRKKYKVSSIADWFKLPSFYIFGFCYMGVRLYSNLFGTLQSFYLVFVLQLGDQNPKKIPFVVALIPLLVYLSSVLTSFNLSKFYEKFGRKTALMSGGVLCIVTAVCMIFLTPDFSWPIYVLAIFIGVAQSTVLATGINLISQVIGTKGEQGAFVFGIYSLLDKFSAGLAIFFIINSSSFQQHDPTFIRYTTVIVPSAACVLACMVVYFTPIEQYSEKAKKMSKKRKSSLEEELIV